MAKTGMSFPPPRMAQNGQQYQTSQQHFNRVVGSVPQEPEMIPSHYVQQAEDEPQQVQKEPLTAEMLAKAKPQAFFDFSCLNLMPIFCFRSKRQFWVNAFIR